PSTISHALLPHPKVQAAVDTVTPPAGPRKAAAKQLLHPATLCENDNLRIRFERHEPAHEGLNPTCHLIHFTQYINHTAKPVRGRPRRLPNCIGNPRILHNGGPRGGSSMGHPANRLQPGPGMASHL